MSLMTTNEVADYFHVDPNTVREWAKAGKIPFTRTPSGRLRFARDDVRTPRDPQDAI